ncbi:3-deoxy-7-phosphoheptulonate synthase [Streptomyces sp. NPDC054834]
MSQQTMSVDLTEEVPESLSATELDALRQLPSTQQPDWPEPELVDSVVTQLTRMPSLVRLPEIIQLRSMLAEAAAGRAMIIQAGNCAEDPAECTPGLLAQQVGLLKELAATMHERTALPVIRVGRIAGQFAKPRSSATENVDGVTLPSFRGLSVNRPEPDLDSRRADPRRLLTSYHAAYRAMRFLRGRDGRLRTWTSHEALLLDYELPLLRRNSAGCVFLSSTHWPWIGMRTSTADSAHLRMLAGVANPVACKVGPHITPAELLEICRHLDPHREPGRLTLIARLGRGFVAERLPALVAAVRRAGHPAIWLCDPMHGNTVIAPGGLKTRLVSVMAEEIREFQNAVMAEGGASAGLHLEATPEPVSECAVDEDGIHTVGAVYTSLCDPRLNPDQAVAMTRVWT